MENVINYLKSNKNHWIICYKNQLYKKEKNENRSRNYNFFFLLYQKQWYNNDSNGYDERRMKSSNIIINKNKWQEKKVKKLSFFRSFKRNDTSIYFFYISFFSDNEIWYKRTLSNSLMVCVKTARVHIYQTRAHAHYACGIHWDIRHITIKCTND